MHKNDPEQCILVVDDEVPLARAIAKRYEREGYRSVVAETLREARVHLGLDNRRNGALAPSLIVLDMRLPDGNGLELIQEVCNGTFPAPPVIVLTAFGDLENAVEAMKRGAADYLRKPIDLDELKLVTDRVMRTAELESQLALSRKREGITKDPIELLGNSAPMCQVREQIQAYASALSSDTKQNQGRTVLILGETGTGKEVAARMLHARSGPAQRPFVHVDCAAFNAADLERQLFGHATSGSGGGHQKGLIEAAEYGGLFLDEIGELSSELQAKLLHVVERQGFRQPGGGTVRVHANLFAATNRPLRELVHSGKFRSDLYYRLNALTIDMPPLRDCPGDASLLAEHFARRTARRFGRPPPLFSDNTLIALDSYSWPGNVRELEHLIQRGVLLSRDRPLTKEMLGLENFSTLQDTTPTAADTATQVPANPIVGMTLEDAEKMLIENALHRTGGNVSRAARMLGVTRMAIRYRIEKHGIELANEMVDG